MDKTIEDLGPAIQEVQPLLGKVETTVDALSLDLLHVNDILGDVSTMTGTASKATESVTGVVEKASHAVNSAVAKVTGRADAAAARLEQAKDDAEKTVDDAKEAVVETVSSDSGYFTYPTGSDKSQED